MAFYGCHFSFDGIPCTEYGLMMYDFGVSNSGEVSDSLTSDVKIVEDRISRRYTPLHYGVVMNEPLKFNMTFGADINSVDKGVYFDRWDLNVIASWLTGHDSYKWLEITQPDMETFRYKCFITNLKHVDIGKMPWGFSCTVVCDSPYAYLYPEVFTQVVNGTIVLNLYNKSAHRGFYKPKLELYVTNGGNFTIQNVSDNMRETKFTGLPTSVSSIVIDNENEVITCNEIQNPYQYFNFNFFRLVHGSNHIILTGNGTVKITCEFPMRIGG